jgi:hypothetical protein
VVTLDSPVAAVATVVRIRNLSATAGRNIDISFVGATAAGVPTYVPPGSELELTYAVGQNMWFASPIVQSGTIALTNGVSANIPADITALSRIVATLKTVSGAFGTPVCGGRVVGTRAGGGLFVITSTLPATGATVATDQGTYDWQVSNDGG